MKAHAGLKEAAHSVRGSDLDLVGPVLEAYVLAFACDDDDLRAPPPTPSTQRVLVLTDTAVAERDPLLNTVTCMRPLGSVHALLRDPADEQAFALQFKSGCVRSYTAAARDAILATLMEAAHGAGFGHVHVLSNANARTALSLRLLPLNAWADDRMIELHTIYLKALAGGSSEATAWEGATRQLVLEFNANIPYSGPCAQVVKRHRPPPAPRTQQPRAPRPPPPPRHASPHLATPSRAALQVGQARHSLPHPAGKFREGLGPAQAHGEPRPRRARGCALRARLHAPAARHQARHRRHRRPRQPAHLGVSRLAGGGVRLGLSLVASHRCGRRGDGSALSDAAHPLRARRPLS